MNYSQTLEGQFYFHLLKEFGMTPQEWRELDPRDSAYLANAYAYANRQQREQYNRRQAKLKRGR